MQAEANQRKQALDAIGKRFNQTNEEKRGLENDYRGLLERENVLKSALKTAEERCVYVDRFQELLSRYIRCHGVTRKQRLGRPDKNDIY